MKKNDATWPEFSRSACALGANDDVWADGAVTTNEAAEWLGCSKRTLWRWMDEGRLPYRHVGHRRRIPLATLREILPSPACGYGSFARRRGDE